MAPSDASDVLERLPDKCFISHAYHRCEDLDALRQRLPARRNTAEKEGDTFVQRLSLKFLYSCRCIKF